MQYRIKFRDSNALLTRCPAVASTWQCSLTRCALLAFLALQAFLNSELCLLVCETNPTTRWVSMNRRRRRVRCAHLLRAASTRKVRSLSSGVMFGQFAMRDKVYNKVTLQHTRSRKWEPGLRTPSLLTTSGPSASNFTCEPTSSLVVDCSSAGGGGSGRGAWFPSGC